jgi:hypothetical protein
LVLDMRNRIDLLRDAVPTCLHPFLAGLSL